MSTISASTTTTTAYQVSADTTGALVIQTGATPTTALTIDTGQRSKFPTTIGVGGATPSTSGSGITFPATQSASSDANTLDDYEEGTWTPSVVATTTNPTVTYTKQAGVYTKIGNLVTVNFQIVLSAISGGSGYAQIGGFPFTAAPSSSTLPSYSSGCFSETGINFTWPSGFTQIAMELTNSTTSAYITFLASAKDQAVVSIANMASGNNYFVGTLSYRTT